MKDIKIVEYKTFTSHLYSGEIKNVEMYKFTGDIELVYTFKDITYGTVGPYGPSDDLLLHHYLDNQNITYTIYDKELNKDDNESFSHELFGSLMFSVPVILSIVIVIQALIIKKLVNKRTTY